MVTSQQSVFKLGMSTVLVPDDEFADGYANGFVAHPKDPSTPLTVTTIHQIIAESLFDVEHPDDWNIGYLVGAISGLREGVRREEDEKQAVQLGMVTLRLNRWRFREGYYNGKLDYKERQNERSSSVVFNARELLTYIAHRNPDTDMYYLGEDELACLEETIGQLVGYVCTALFSKHVDSIEPLPMTVLQKA